MVKGISPEQLIATYPRVYHMAEAGSWPSIAKYGLLSTSALLDLFEVKGDRRHSIESEHRPESVPITHSRHGAAVIRDQKPLRERTLAGCLDGCTTTQWFEFLNAHVFFWATERRVRTLLTARAYRGREHLVLTIDTRRLVDQYGNSIVLSPINSGSTIYRPVRRGISTFQPLVSYPYEQRRRLRGTQNAIAELAISRAVPNIRDLTISVERRQGERLIQVFVA